ncbi:hypothetical protein HY992_04385 [Candidatus Micrarchaeota archaeon]|nr:hypothetical protein [Candidatus Micrarchaeota archaeon]
MHEAAEKASVRHAARVERASFARKIPLVGRLMRGILARKANRRYKVIALLRKKEGKELFEALEFFLKSRNEFERAGACHYLVAFGGKEIIPVLRELVESKDDVTRGFYELFLCRLFMLGDFSLEVLERARQILTANEQENAFRHEMLRILSEIESARAGQFRIMLAGGTSREENAQELRRVGALMISNALARR